MNSFIKFPFTIFLVAFTMLIFIASCGDDDDPADTVQSDRCNMGQKATLTLDITGVGIFNFSESTTAISHATDTEGSGVDALSMYIYWKDPASSDSLAYDVTVENENISQGTTYAYNTTNFNGTVNFYRYTGGVLQDHFTFSDWTTTITELEEYQTSSAGGYTTTRMAFVDAMTSGTLTRVGAGTTHAFTSSYTICPKY